MKGGALPYYSSPLLFQQGRGQYGNGISNVLGRLFNRVLPFFQKPLVKQGLKRIGKAAAEAGLSAASTALTSDKSFGTALQEAGKEQAKTLVKEAQGILEPPTPKVDTPIKTKKPRLGRVVGYKTRARPLDVFDYK